MKHRAGSEGARQSPPALALFATWPAGPREQRLSALVIAASLIGFAVAAPFAKLPLAAVWAFIPLYSAALVVSDLITALLLFGQYRMLRSRAVLVLACGYGFSALSTIAHGLSFPGLFAPQGMLGGGAQTTAWLYMFWHAGFPLFVVGYTLLSRADARLGESRRPVGPVIALACTATALLVLGFTWLATAQHDALPAIMAGHRYTTAMTGVVSSVWLTGLIALALLWRRRPHAVLDLWLMVVVCAWLLDVALSAVLNAGRFDLGFYVGRAYGLMAATFVLGVLLLENGRLYAALAESHALERSRAAALRELSDQLEVVNERLSNSNAQLQEQTRLKSEFLANMSHELRTPLNSVIGFSDMLQQGIVAEVEQQRRFAGHIFSSGHHLLALINDILDLSKIEAGKTELSWSELNVEQELADAAAMMEGQALARRIALTIEPRGTVGVIRADARRVRQILLNLISNALKFSPSDSTVILRAERVSRQRAAEGLPGHREGVRKPLPASDFEHFVELTVTDVGGGIARADLERLFAPFTQIESAQSQRGEGSGLGLVIVHRLADLHGGSVAVTSEPGRGSCFTVWLPQRQALAAQAGEVGDAHAPAVRAARIALVVEDNDEAAALMQAQLTAKGLAVRRVGSAEAALALVDSFTPDLITLDILLPGMDGWQLLARLKSTPSWEAVPVVVVSLVADQGRGFSLGAALVLQKPIAQQALDRGLERLGLAPGVGRQVTVLVIDDEAEAVELLAAKLRLRDFVVLRALGGREGIDLARRFRPDLITLDLEMPEVNGFEVVEALKGSAATAHIPIVVITAKDLTDSDRGRLNEQVLDIVGKSEFNHGRFVGEVERALSTIA